MKPTIVLKGGLTTLVASLCLTSCTSPSLQATKSVAVTQIVEHPSLDAVRDGLKAELVQAGFEPDKTLRWQWESAQGNPTTATQIAQKFAGEAPNVMVAISTPSAQAAASVAKQIPVVFSAVTDPINAKLVSNLERPGGMVTGVQAFAPVDKHLDLIAQMLPGAKRIGVVYNAGESNSVSVVNALKQVAAPRQMTIVEATVSNTSEVANASKSLVGRADVIYIPTDNTVVSALNSVLQVGIANKLPVFAGDNESVEKGAIASLGFDYRDIGQQTGKMVIRILQGEAPGQMAVEPPRKEELVINTKAAQQMGVTVPPQVLSKAVKVIQ
jgi:putative ABC transport system substrate-binding protein